MAIGNKRKLVMRDEKVNKTKSRKRIVSTTLPDHLLFDEILTRLPAKSLIRFQSVCKNWNSTISKPAFTRLHHNRAHTRPHGGNLAIYFRINRRMTVEEVFFTAHYQGGPAVPHPPFGSRSHNASISTNGLLLECSKDKLQSFRPCIYNPATKEEHDLPSLIDYIGYFGWNSIRFEFYSFGYDPFTGLYKVLAMCSLSSYEYDDYDDDVDYDEEEARDVGYCLLIFVLGTESWTWRKLDLDFPKPRRFVSSSDDDDNDCCVSGCCVNGALYWLVRGLDGDGKITNGYEYILAFDVGKEKFRNLPLPGKLGSSCDDIMVSEVGNCLALTRNKLDENGVPQVWVYKKEEWMKMEIEVPLPWKIRNNMICEVRAIRGGDKLLVIPFRETITDVLRVYYYDNIRRKWSKVKVTGVPVDVEYEYEWDYNRNSNLKLKFKVAYEVSNNVETLFSPVACVDWDNLF